MAVCVPSFFEQLIRTFANPVFQFCEAHLTEVGVGWTELKLHNVPPRLSYLPAESCAIFAASHQDAEVSSMPTGFFLTHSLLHLLKNLLRFSFRDHSDHSELL